MDSKTCNSCKHFRYDLEVYDADGMSLYYEACLKGKGEPDGYFFDLYHVSLDTPACELYELEDKK